MKTPIAILLAALILFSACIDDGNTPTTTTTITAAELTAAEKVCDMLADDVLKNDCFSIVRRDASACEKMADEKKDYCYWNLGTELSDSLLCDKIDSELFRADCYSAVSDDEKVCDRFTDATAKDNCNYQFAKKKEDKTICEKITGASSILSECYSSVAIGKKDISICDEIKGEENEIFKNSCYVLVIDEMGEEVTEPFCSKVSEAVRGFCYATIATETGDCSVCAEADKYPYTLFLDESLELGEGEKEQDTLFCEEYCAIGKAKKDKDAAACEEMEYMFSETCYIELAILLQDETLCERAGTYAPFCYEELAKVKGDAAICDANTDEIERDLCYFATAQKISGTKRTYVY